MTLEVVTPSRCSRKSGKCRNLRGYTRSITSNWVIEIVSTGKVDFIRFSFMVAGHTKFAPDCNIANAYKKAEVFTISEVKSLCDPLAITFTEDSTNILTWRDLVRRLDTSFLHVTATKKNNAFHAFHGMWLSWLIEMMLPLRIQLPITERQIR